MDEEAKQTSFEPPPLALGVKAASGAFQHLKGNSAFALSILGTGQKDIAFAFFKPTEQEGDSSTAIASRRRRRARRSSSTRRPGSRRR